MYHIHYTVGNGHRLQSCSLSNSVHTSRLEWCLKVFELLDSRHHVLNITIIIFVTRGPWDTSLTWKTVQIFHDYIIRLILRGENQSFFFLFKCSLFVKPWVTFTQGCLKPSFVIISPLKRAWPFFHQNFYPHHPRMLCVKFGWNWTGGSGSWFSNFVNVFSQFRNYLPLKTGVALHLNELESPLPKNALCQVWLKLVQRFWRRRFSKFVNVFSLFRNYLPLENGVVLHLNKLVSPVPKDALCQAWLKLAQWFCIRRFSNFVHEFSLFRLYLPLDNGVSFILINLNPLYPKMLCVNFGWNWPSGSWEEDENVKSLLTNIRTDGRTTDNRRSEKLTWAFSSGELKT